MCAIRILSRIRFWAFSGALVGHPRGLWDTLGGPKKLCVVRIVSRVRFWAFSGALVGHPRGLWDILGGPKKTVCDKDLVAHSFLGPFRALLWGSPGGFGAFLEASQNWV